jgi:hypothetical protein
MKKKMKRMAMEAGAGVLTAAALAAAAAYLLSSKKQKASAKAWAKKARHAVAKNIKKARRMSEAEYKRLVVRATKQYGSLHKVNAREVAKVAADMKTEWKRLRKDAKVMAKMMQAKKRK